MAIKSETRLGPYEIVSAIGAGGMGEVYRARDPRLGRDVAIKVLPAAWSADGARLHRFEQEARAAAALNHPNILAVHDIGTQDGSPYIVSEVLDGSTLRERLRTGPLPIRKATDYAQQIARGLAAAHDKGIIHRDLKPENIFITNDGRVKILDFGLAKLTRPESVADGQTLTQTLASDPGTVLGTVGYMSPEQVRGRPADTRSDLFSFGAILYEMLSGKRAFHGDTPADTMSAILKDEPPELTETNHSVPPALESIVRHCLEKPPQERFQSARDIAFDLQLLSSVSSTAMAPVTTRAVAQKRIRTVATIIAGLLLFVLAVSIVRLTAPATPVPHYTQLTYRRGTVRAGRFAPDGQIVYSAAWDGDTTEVFATASTGRGGTSTGIRDSDIQAISTTGELLVIGNRARVYAGVQPGMLARVPPGAAPRPVLDGVQAADWGPDGNSIAVSRYVGQHFRLEYPAGKVLYETTTGWITWPRVSPKGDMVAFFEHPYFGDDAGVVSVIDLQGHKRVLTPDWQSERGLAWASNGSEVWFTANTTGIALDLYGANLSGKLRTILRVPGDLRLLDIRRDGRVLITQGQRSRAAMASAAGQKSDRDLAVADWSFPVALSSDGRSVLLEEEAEGTASGAYTLYLRKLDGSPPVRLGQGVGRDLSRDEKWALALSQAPPEQFILLPTGPGEPQQITHDAITHRAACFVSDGGRIAFTGVDSGHAPRVYVQDIKGGAPRPVGPEGVQGGIEGEIACSPVGASVVVAHDGLWLVPLDGGSSAHPIPDTNREDAVAGWSAEGQSVYTYRRGEWPAKLYRVAVASGKRVFVREVAPTDAAGANYLSDIRTSADLHSYVYGFTRELNGLYVVEGLK